MGDYETIDILSHFSLLFSHNKWAVLGYWGRFGKHCIDTLLILVTKKVGEIPGIFGLHNFSRKPSGN